MTRKEFLGLIIESPLAVLLGMNISQDKHIKFTKDSIETYRKHLMTLNGISGDGALVGNEEVLSFYNGLQWDIGIINEKTKKIMV